MPRYKLREELDEFDESSLEILVDTSKYFIEDDEPIEMTQLSKLASSQKVQLK